MAAEGGTVPKNVRSSGANEPISRVRAERVVDPVRGRCLTPVAPRTGPSRVLPATSLVLAGAGLVVLAGPAYASPASGSAPPRPPGPTRTFNVPMAYTLPAGARLFTTNLTLGSTGLAPIYSGAPGLSLGIVGNAVNVHADAALSSQTEVGAGIAATSTNPWRGALDIEGKRAVMEEGVNGAPASLAATVGAIFDVDANGVPDIGFQLGVPITKALAFTRRQVVTLSLFPSWNVGMMGAQGAVGPRPINTLGLGFGMDLALSPFAHVLADTNLGLKLGGIQTDSALGFRYAFSPTMLGQVFLGVGASGPGAAANGLGVGAIMGF